MQESGWRSWRSYVKQEPSIWTEVDMSKSQNLQWAFASCGRGQPRHVGEGCRQCRGLQLQWLFYSCPKSPGCKSKLLSSWNWPTPFPWDCCLWGCTVFCSNFSKHRHLRITVLCMGWHSFPNYAEQTATTSAASNNTHVSLHSFHETGVQPQPDQASFSGSHWAIIRPMGLWSQLRLGIHVQIHVVVGRFHFRTAVELMVACFFKVSRGIFGFYFKSFICLGSSYLRASSFWLRINKLRSLTTSAKSILLGLII